MMARGERMALWRYQAKAALVVAKKDVLIYYFKPPVVIFGLVFPLFFFLAFAVGRERQARIYEVPAVVTESRPASAPVPAWWRRRRAPMPA